MPDLVAYARSTAARAGINPDYFERQIRQESGFDPNAHNASGADGIAQIIERFHPAMAGKTRDPIASLDYAADLIASYRNTFGSYVKAFAAYNWGSGNVAGWNGKRGSLPAETQRYLDIILGPSWDAEAPAVPTLTYNPDAPVDIQTDPFSCSEQSAQWLLRSIGRNPGDAWIRDQFLHTSPPLMTPEYGLMDASGASLAAWLQTEYGDEMGLTFTSKNGASWDDLAAIAGTQPLMIGGRTWSHWSGVRRLQDGGLELANPAPNWKDVGVLLDRDEFDRYGTWSYVTVSDGSAPPPPDPPPSQPSKAEWQAIYDQIGALLPRMPA